MMKYVKAVYEDPAPAVEAAEDLIMKGYPVNSVDLKMEHDHESRAFHRIAKGLNENFLSIFVSVFLWLGLVVAVMLATRLISVPGIGLNAASPNPVLAHSFQPPVQPSSGIIYSGTLLGIIAGCMISIVLSLVKYSLKQEEMPVNSQETTLTIDAIGKKDLSFIENSIEIFEPDGLTVMEELKRAA